MVATGQHPAAEVDQVARRPQHQRQHLAERHAAHPFGDAREQHHLEEGQKRQYAMQRQHAAATRWKQPAACRGWGLHLVVFLR